MEAQLCFGSVFFQKNNSQTNFPPKKSINPEAFGAGASQRGDMQCLHRCLREGPRMAKGLTAATVHEVSGGEVMEGFRSLFRYLRIFLKVYT